MGHPRPRIVLLLLLACVLGSCRMWAPVIVSAHPREPEVVLHEGLHDLLSENPRPSVALRVPSPTGGVLTEQRASASELLNEIYFQIERGLFAAGFTVIDRGLMQNLLGPGGTESSYRAIQTSTQADLILDIVSFTPCDFGVREVRDASDDSVVAVNPSLFQVTGWRIDCRVVLVGSGAVGATVTTWSKPGDCRFAVRKSRLAPITSADLARRTGDDGRVQTDAEWRFPIEDSVADFTQVLVQLLRREPGT